MVVEPILIHTHFHRRRTGVTRSVENVFPFFAPRYDAYIYGYGIEGRKISFRRLLQILFSKKETVVHCHRNNETMQLLLFRFFGAKFKLVVSRHSETSPSGLTRFLFKKADHIVTLTNTMSRRLGIPNTVVGHGVDIDFFAPGPEKNLPDILQKNVITCAGRVRKAKGQKVLLEAAAPLLKQYPDWGLIITGKVDSSAFFEELKNIVEEHQIEAQVYFLGETSDITSIYRASDLVVVPSYTEGFSLVCAEAMSCGCTVIATQDVGVHSDMISANENGYLFEAGNFIALRHLLEKIIIKEIPYLGENARNEIVRNWSSEKEAEGLINVYQKLIIKNKI